MSLNLIPPEQISSMTDSPMFMAKAQGYLPRIQAEANNVLGSNSVMPPEYVARSPGQRIMQGMNDITKKLGSVHQTPGFDFKKNASANLIRMQNRAKENAQTYQGAKKTVAELFQMKTEHDQVKYQDLMARQAAFEKQWTQSATEARQRVAQLRQMRVDPSRFFKSQTAWENILGFVATVATGSLLHDMGVDPNMALVGIQNSIEQDIALQQQEISAAYKEHNNLMKMDEADMLMQMKLLKQRQDIYTNNSALVKDTIDSMSDYIDNDQTRNGLHKLGVNIWNSAGKKYVEMALAGEGLKEALAATRSQKAADKLLEKANMNRVADGTLASQGWVVASTEGREHDPMVVVENNGGVIPDKPFMDPNNPKQELPNQPLIRQSVNKYLKGKAVRNGFADIDSSGVLTEAGKNEQKQALLDTTDDLNTYNVETGGPTHDSKTAVVNFDGKRVYIDSSIGDKKISETKAEFDGLKTATATLGKLVLLTGGIKDRSQDEQDRTFKLIKKGMPSSARDEFFEKPDETNEGKRYFKVDLFDQLLAKAGVNNIFKTEQGGETVLQELRVLGVHYSKLIADMVPFVTGQKPGMRVSDADIKRAEDTVGVDIMGPLLNMKNDPRGAIDQMRSTLQALLDYQINNTNNRLAETLAEPAMRFSTEIRDTAGLNMEDKLKRVLKGMPAGSFNTSTEVGDIYGRKVGVLLH